MKRVTNGQVKSPVSKKRTELRPVAIGVLDRTHAGLIALGHPPDKEPPPPGITAGGDPRSE